MEKYFIDVKELREMGYGRDAAGELIRIVRHELTEKGKFLPYGLLAPRTAVLRKAGVIE